MLTDCVGPYFRNIFLQDVKGAYYTLCFDETTNDANRKELHSSIRHYSEQRKRIHQFHFETFFIENGEAETMVKYLIQALHNAKLPLEHMIALGRDGPNVNKKVFRLMNDKSKALTGKNVFDVGSSNIHTVHNAFKKGLDVYGNNVVDLLIKIFYFFDGESLRLQEFNNIQKRCKRPLHRIIKHVSSRWLTLLDSDERLIEQWDPVNEYFLKHIPNIDQKLWMPPRNQNIVKHLKCGLIKGKKREIEFFILT